MRLYFAILCMLVLISCVQIEQTKGSSLVQENKTALADEWCKERVITQYLPEFNLRDIQITRLRCWPHDQFQIQFELDGLQGADQVHVYFYLAGGASHETNERCLIRNGELIRSERIFQRLDGYETREKSACVWQ